MPAEVNPERRGNASGPTAGARRARASEEAAPHLPRKVLTQYRHQSGAAIEAVGLVASEAVDKHFIREVIDHHLGCFYAQRVQSWFEKFLRTLGQIGCRNSFSSRRGLAIGKRLLSGDNAQDSSGLKLQLSTLCKT